MSQFRVDVTSCDDSWATNALRFDTHEDAENYAYDLWSRWMGAKRLRVVTEDTPDREPVDLTDPRIVIGGE